MNYIFIFIGIVILKFLYNLIHYLNNFRLYKIWKNYFKNINDEKTDNTAITYTNAIKNHFNQANLKDISIPIASPIGFGQIATTTATAFDNLFANDRRSFIPINDAFLQARGIYRSRMLESFNPFYWVKLIIYLPKNLISYLGLDTNTIFTNIFQIIYWIINSILIAVYQSEISIFVKNVVDSVAKLFK